jgi:hydroxymethylbilane synthase
LALWQAEFIKKQLESITSEPVRLEIIKTSGDRIDNLSFEKMEGQGFFTKELEEALLTGTIDLAVHSLKDLMTTMPDGLTLGAVGFREDNSEAILIRKESYDPEQTLQIKEGGVIGSSSVRRQCQIAKLSPDLELKDLRGNVPTRVNKLRDGLYDAIIIACAGIKRLALDISDLKINILECRDFLPAPGQGILGIQIRENDDRIGEIVSSLDDPTARKQTQLERGLLARFEGGCQLPLGAWSRIADDSMSLHAVLGCRKEDRWIGLARTSISGENIDNIVETAYKELITQRESLE